MKLGAIFSGKCEDPGLLEEIDVRFQVYSKLIAEDYANMVVFSPKYRARGNFYQQFLWLCGTPKERK